MQPLDVPQDLLAEMAQSSEREIIARFAAYGFADALGHPLAQCLDFLALVALARRPPEAET